MNCLENIDEVLAKTILECNLSGINLAKGVGLPIAFGARDELKRCCKAIVDSGDLRDILKHID